MNKICTICNTNKNLDEYGILSRSSDGHYPQCPLSNLIHTWEPMPNLWAYIDSPAVSQEEADELFLQATKKVGW
jgi:hypothetical protein